MSLPNISPFDTINYKNNIRSKNKKVPNMEQVEQYIFKHEQSQHYILRFHLSGKQTYKTFNTLKEAQDLKHTLIEKRNTLKNFSIKTIKEKNHSKNFNKIYDNETIKQTTIEKNLIKIENFKTKATLFKVRIAINGNRISKTLKTLTEAQAFKASLLLQAA